MHIKALDGIRGLAVLLVVLFHFGYAPFGWIGVQIFFVLSGYLITSILLKTSGMPLVPYLGRFYWRRALRIFPLYFTVLSIGLGSYLLWQTPTSFLSDLPYLVSYTTNFGRIRHIDIGPTFGHLWSLAVEEQFYLIWPLVIYAMPRARLKSVVLSIIVAAPLIRLATYLYFRDSPEIVGRAIYSLPFSQFDGFAFGAAIVLWDMQKIGNAGRLFGISLTALLILGATTVLYMHFLGGGAFKGALGYPMYLMPLYGFVWAYSLIDIVAMLGIAFALRRLGKFNFLEHSALIYIGTISYGIYVFHVPLLLALRSIGYDNFVIYVGATILISAASFRWLESPFLLLKGPQQSALADK